MNDFGLEYTNLEPDAGSSWSLRFSLQSDDGRWLHIQSMELTSQRERARLITAQQAQNLKKLYPELRGLKLRRGLGK